MQFKNCFPVFEHVIVSTKNFESELFFSNERKYHNQKTNNKWFVRFQDKIWSKNDRRKKN